MSKVRSHHGVSSPSTSKASAAPKESGALGGLTDKAKAEAKAVIGTGEGLFHKAVDNVKHGSALSNTGRAIGTGGGLLIAGSGVADLMATPDPATGETHRGRGVLKTLLGLGISAASLLISKGKNAGPAR